MPRHGCTMPRCSATDGRPATRSTSTSTLAEHRPDLAEAQPRSPSSPSSCRTSTPPPVLPTRAFALDPADPRDPRAQGDHRLPPRQRPAGGGGDGGGGRSPAIRGTSWPASSSSPTGCRPGIPPGRSRPSRTGLAAVPGDEGLHLARLALLEEKGDDDAVGAELTTMNRLFPDNAGARAALVRWHLSHGAPAAAEAVLRAAAGRSRQPRPGPDPRPVPARGEGRRGRPGRARRPRRRGPRGTAGAESGRSGAGTARRPTCAPSPGSTSPRAGPTPRSRRSAASSPAWPRATRPATSRSPSPRCCPRPARPRRAPPSSRRCFPRTVPMSAR